MWSDMVPRVNTKGDLKNRRGFPSLPRAPSGSGITVSKVHPFPTAIYSSMSSGDLNILSVGPPRSYNSAPLVSRGQKEGDDSVDLKTRLGKKKRVL